MTSLGDASPNRVEVLIAGAGFSGSILSLILRRLGYDVLLIDKDRHPRFAIGESSTPAADFTLERLAARYELPILASLARYGRWRRDLPAVRRGLKRGFSYFHHAAGRTFHDDAERPRQLLVAASDSDEVSDTHWLRADVDALLVRTAEEAAAPVWQSTALQDLEPAGSGWRITLDHNGESRTVRAEIVIDASGPAAAVASRLQPAIAPPPLLTRSHAVYAHLHGVGSWTSVLRERTAIHAHPFDCDQAAQHHLLGGDGWLWILRFDEQADPRGLASVGLVLQGDGGKSGTALANKDPREWLQRYPDVHALLAGAEVAETPGRWIRTGRLQRRLARAAGRNWAALPNAAGLIDPLHSTGIAHALIGVERLADAFAIQRRRRDSQRWEQDLARHDDFTRRELDWIDLLVSGCYRCLPDEAMFESFVMSYFAAATSDELRRRRQPDDAWLPYLCAEQEGLTDAVRRLWNATEPDALSATEFRKLAERELQPWNEVGLFHPPQPGMYEYTATK